MILMKLRKSWCGRTFLAYTDMEILEVRSNFFFENNRPTVRSIKQIEKHRCFGRRKNEEIYDDLTGTDSSIGSGMTPLHFLFMFMRYGSVMFRGSLLVLPTVC